VELFFIESQKFSLGLTDFPRSLRSYCPGQGEATQTTCGLLLHGTQSRLAFSVLSRAGLRSKPPKSSSGPINGGGWVPKALEINMEDM